MSAHDFAVIALRILFRINTIATDFFLLACCNRFYEMRTFFSSAVAVNNLVLNWGFNFKSRVSNKVNTLMKEIQIRCFAIFGSLSAINYHRMAFNIHINSRFFQIFLLYVSNDASDDEGLLRYCIFIYLYIQSGPFTLFKLKISQCNEYMNERTSGLPPNGVPAQKHTSQVNLLLLVFLHR